MKELVTGKQVIFLSADQARMLREPQHLISVHNKGNPTIDMFWDHMPEAPGRYSWEFEREDGRKVTLTRVDIREDSMYSVDPVEARKIVDAAIAANGEPIVVNCRYGMVRSFSIACWIRDQLGYELAEHRWCVEPKLRTHDHGLMRALQTAYENYLKEQA